MSQSGILLFCNMSPVIWYNKKKNYVQTSTFGSDFTALKKGIRLTQAIKYKLQMFGVPLDVTTNIYCDNEVMYNNDNILESVLSKNHHLVLYHACGEAVDSGMVIIAKENTLTNLADLFTKVLPIAFRERLLYMFIY